MKRTPLDGPGTTIIPRNDFFNDFNKNDTMKSLYVKSPRNFKNILFLC